MAHAYAHGLYDVPLLGETIGENFDRIVSLHGSREALVSCHQDVRLTYDELHVAVSRLASGLLGRGIGKGDRVGIWSPNCVEWVLVQYATAAIGAILVNVNPAYRTHELAYAIKQSGVRLLVSAPAHGQSDYAAMVAETRAELGALEEAVFLGSPEWDELSGHGLDDERAGGTRRRARLRRPDQHPVHERARPASRRARRSRTTTSSTTASSSPSCSATASTTACACRCRSTTASAW